jgi:hypothetical protein
MPALRVVLTKGERHPKQNLVRPTSTKITVSSQPDQTVVFAFIQRITLSPPIREGV